MTSQCNFCNGVCEVRISKSSKNPGKAYFYCADGCKGWNGWAITPAITKNTNNPENDVINSNSNNFKNAKNAKNASKKRKLEDPKVCRCNRCNQVVDPEWEFYLTSIGRSARLGIPIEEIKRCTRTEFMRDVVTSAEYGCEKCHVVAMNYYK